MASYAVSWSGGKDSTLALDRALRQGYHVTHLFNIFEGSSGLVRFHGVDHRLIKQQAQALGLELVQEHTHPDDFETVFDRVLETLKNQGVAGIIFGNIHLQDIRGWFESKTSGHGLEHVEPLWGSQPEIIVQEFLDRGFSSTIVGIDLSRSHPDWLGSRFDADFLARIRTSDDIDLCGERGEYHSFVSDGPIFLQPVDFTVRGTDEIDGHRFLLLESETAG